MKSIIAAAIMLSVNTITWMHAAEAKPKKSGPLAELPSKPGPHIAKIKALGDNEWLNLGPAAPDPKWGSGSVRGWGCRMEHAADLGGSFVSGQGPHGYIKPDGHYDDIFFYDMYAHRWICLVPGIDTRTFVDDIKKGEIAIGEKGYLIYKNGEPVYANGGHTYQNHYYDSDRKCYVSGGWPSGLPIDMHSGNLRAPWYVDGRKALEEKLNGKTYPSEWLSYAYDANTGKMSRDLPKGQFYIPSRKGCWTYWSKNTSLSSVGQLNPGGPLPDERYGGDFPGCFDSKRERIYVGRINPRTNANDGDWFIYDFKANLWSKPPTKGEIEVIPTTTHGMVHYDAANDRVVEFYGWALGTKGIGVWDPETNSWEPKIAFPDSFPMGTSMSGFYSLELNAHFVHIGSDGAAGGDIWVYRYKNANKGSKKSGR
jgi:hypothetical protein